jgi:hypothetical protein
MPGPDPAATLLDAYAVEGRGTVVICGDISGAILMGDVGSVGDLSFTVIGQEARRFAGADEFPADTMGLLVDHTETAAFKALTGQRIAFGLARAP